jgi:hypothetical protein
MEFGKGNILVRQKRLMLGYVLGLMSIENVFPLTVLMVAKHG